MGLFHKEGEVLPLGIIIVIMGLVSTAVSMPHFFEQISFIEERGYGSGLISLMGAFVFMTGVSLVFSGSLVLMRYRGAMMLAAIDLSILLGVLLMALYLALGDPLAFVILAVIVLVCFCFYMMRQSLKPFRFMK
jgi:hypothetical protein